jgi:CheY-like chemotaxis protein
MALHLEGLAHAVTAPESAYVLIVEDDPETASIFRQMLELRGYQVEVAHGSAQAMLKLSRRLPDLVLLDVMMPDVSGLEVVRYLRRDPQTAHLPVVIVSAKAQSEDIAEGLEAGATAYLTKPISMEQLIRHVADALSSSAH